MIILIVFAFLSGIVTILSPCILPVLPIVLSSSLGGGKKRPLGVVSGFIVSFTFFTLFLTSIVKAFNIPADLLRSFSIVIIFTFGVSLLIPAFQEILEKLFTKLAGYTPKSSNKEGFSGGFLVGMSIGLIWTPCVGPILASVISLALTGSVTSAAFFITLAYSIGTAIPMLAIVWGGRNLLNKIPWLLANTTKIQKAFGFIMIATALAIYLNLDRKFQTYILNKFTSYGAGLTKLEDSEIVKQKLEELEVLNSENTGKPMFDLLDSASNAPEIIPGGSWFNLPDGEEKLTIKELEGQVVLIDFWTYTCINCIRTLPYLQKWHETYKDNNFVLIGVHTPEFEFEKNENNLYRAIEDFGLTYPIVQDNNYATWRAYNNRYWPAKYLIDKNGKIRYTHFGEGNYDETEEMIQTLIEETGKQTDVSINNPKYSVQTKTPELYLGYGRMEFFTSTEQLMKNKQSLYESPSNIPLHHFAFNGKWEVNEEYSQAFANSKITLNYEAKDVFLVMKSSTSDSIEARVLLDGNDIGIDAGEDVNNSVVKVDKDRLYELVSSEKSGRHTLTIEFTDGNIEVYAFTFG